MKTFFKLIVLLVSLSGLGLWTGNAYAATCTSTGSGNWNVGGIWSCPGTPGAGDDVIIASPYSVTLNANQSALTLTVDNGATLQLNSLVLTVSSDITINGTVNDAAVGGSGGIASTGNAAVVSGNGAFTGEARLYFSGTAPSIAAGSTLDFSGTTQIRAGRTSGGATVAGSVLTIDGTLTSTASAGNFLRLYGNSTIIGATGVINAAPSQITYQTAAATLTNNGNVTILDVIGNGAGLAWTNAAGSTLTVGGALLATGTISATAAGNTVNYNGAAQTGKVATYDNLTLSGSGTKTFATTPTVNNVLSMEGTATVTVTAGVVTYGANATLQYNTATARTVSSEEWISPFAASGGIIIANTGIITMGVARTLNATAPLTINNGATLTTGNFVVTVNGNVNNSGTITSGTGSITLSGGASSHTLSGNGAYANLILNDANGATLAGSPTVTGVLTLTNGSITTGANILEVTSNCTTGISGGGATTFVLGNLRLHYPTNAGTTTCNFPVGSTGAYTPASVAMLNVTSTLANSTLTVRTDITDHADTTAGTSGIDPAKSINRYWTLTPGGSLTFATYNTTFTFVAGDIDGGAATANFIIARKNGGTWTYPTMGAKNPLNTTATGMTSAGGFGEFAIGEPISISGTVFEDINYGGGAGRDLFTSSGAAISGARVELYNAAGNFVTATTTLASGIYRFDSLANGTYTVRVASNGATGIRSTRTGGAGCATCVPVQTYRTNAVSGTAAAVTDHVGGENPVLVDAADNTTSATLASLTTGATTAQSITTVTKTAPAIYNVDFGFNFDTIVSVRNTGQGSLRQFITNANALGGEGTLAQNGLTAGNETTVFMIPDGNIHPGNFGYANQLTLAGANAGSAVITLAGALPAISGPNTSLDATTQTSNVGNTNPGTVGTGGTVGVSAIALAQFNRPEVVIAAGATQVSGTGTGVIIKGLAVSNGGFIVAGNSSVVQDCLAGMDANGIVTTTYGATFGIIAGAGTNILINHNYVKVNNSGIRGDNPGASLIIEYNEVDSIDGTPGGGHTNTFDGILIVNSATNVTVRYNLVNNQRGGALEFGFGTGAVTGVALENTLLNSGFTSPGVPSTEGMGIAAYSLAAGTSISFQQNIITGSARTGIAVVPGGAPTAGGITLSRNSFYANGTIGIDLNPISSDPNTYTPQGVTINDLNDADAGPNGLLNYPVLDVATVSGGNLDISGWARPGSVIELFIADGDPSGFGEGRTYLTTLTEGSGADTDAAVSTYGPAAINGIVQGTDNTNRFRFVIPLPGGVSSGTVLTATATLANSTSEFSGNVTVREFPSIMLTKMVSVNWDPVNLFVNPKFIPGSLAEYTIIATNSGGPVDIDATAIIDAIPANTSLYVKDIGGAGSGPVLFSQGATSSTLTYTFGPILGLADPADDLEFSNDGGTTWNLSPPALTFDATTGCDTTVPPITNIRIKLKGTFIGNSTPPHPSFNLSFRVCVK